MTSVSNASATGITAVSDGSALDACNTTLSLVFVKGKRYRMEFTGTITSGTAPAFDIVNAINWSTPNVGFGGHTLTVGANSKEWTSNESGTFVGVFYLISQAGAFVIADLKIVPTGAVA